MNVKVSYYGKLPFSREFIRDYVPGRATDAFIRWLDMISPLFDTLQEANDALLYLDFIFRLEEGKGPVWGTITRSSDGMRPYPFALFSSAGAESIGPANMWSLLLSPCWLKFREILKSAPQSENELAEGLRGLDSSAFSDAELQEAEAAFLNRAPSSLLKTETESGTVERAIHNLMVLQDFSAGKTPTHAISVALRSEEPEVESCFWLYFASKIHAGNQPVSVFVLTRNGDRRLFIFYRVPSESDIKDVLFIETESRLINIIDNDWGDTPMPESLKRRISLVMSHLKALDAKMKDVFEAC